MALLQKSIAEMATFCPDLVYEKDASANGGSWTGGITPLKSLDGLPDLLDDIHHGRPLLNAAGGELRHLVHADGADHVRDEPVASGAS